LGLIGATIVAGILGLLTGILTLRLRGIYANTMTWFLALTMMAVVSAAVGLTRGKLGLNVPLFLSTGNLRPYYYILLPMAVVLYAIMQRTVNSTVGLAFRAIGQNVDVARASGVDPVRYKVANLAMSCAFAGLLGGYYAHYLGVLTRDVLNTSHSMEGLTLAYIGGRGSLWGGAVAAFLLIPIFEYLKPLMEIRLIIYGLLMILVMIFYPRGIAGVFRQVQARLRGAGKASLWPTGRSKSAKK
jgi:branched-chain amino acid transport system permease protein